MGLAHRKGEYRLIQDEHKQISYFSCISNAVCGSFIGEVII